MVQTILVCVRTQASAQTIYSVAARLGVAHAVRTAVTVAEVLDRLGQRPADLVLADSALARPNFAKFSRQVLALSPQSRVILFGIEGDQAAAEAIAAGAEAALRLDTADPIITLATTILLVLAQPEPDTPALPMDATKPSPARAGKLVAPSPMASGLVAGHPAGDVPTDNVSTMPQQGAGPADPQDLRALWQLIEDSSLGADGAQQLRQLVDPVRSALVASRAGLGVATPAVRYLLTEFIQACYSGDEPDDSAFTHVRTLAWLLIQAGRRGEATELWRLASAAGEPRAGDEVARLQAPDRRQVRLTEREMQVLRGMAEGKSNAEIGRDLYISEDSVKTHARRLFRKLGARDRAHVVATGFRLGLLH